MPASDLQYYGHGGGNGIDSQPLQALPDLFKKNMVLAARDIYGAGAVVRSDITALYDPATDSYGTPAYSNVDPLINYARTYGCRVMLDVHSRNNSATGGTTDAIPRIQTGTGKMDGWMALITAILNHYQQDIIDGVLWCIEIWNEPNSIGSVLGHLDGPGADPSTGVLTAGGGSFTMNSRSVPYYEIVGRLVKDAATAAQDWRAAHGNPTLYVSGPCSGAIDNAYVRAILDWGMQSGIAGGALTGRQEMTTTQKNNDRGFFVEYPVGGSPGRRLLNGVSVHVYQNHDALVETGGTTKVRALDTIGTDFRPLLKKYQAGGWPGTGILITEGITAGSDKWNRYQTYNGVEGAGKAALDAHGGIINWENVNGAGRPANQSATDLVFPIVQRNFYRKARALNNSGAGIEGIIPHILIREKDVTQTDATTNGGYPAWQFSRAFLKILSGSAYIPASGSPFRSSQWFPVAGVIHDEIASYSATSAPSNTKLPAINDLTPVVGQTLTVTPGTWTGSPTPSLSYQWQRGTTAIGGATTTTYTVTTADIGSTLRVVETATSTAGTGTATSTATSVVADPTPVGIPVNQTIPTLSDTDGALSATNHPNPGKQITADPGTWSPDPTSYSYSWERMAPDGTITLL